MSKTTNGRRTRRGIHGQIVEEVGNRIVRGDWEPGEQLPDESVFGSELDVSRTVVREAMKVLSEKGLIASRPRIGTRVSSRDHWNHLDPDVLKWIFANKPTKKDADDLIELRRMIEPGAAKLAAKRISEDEIEALRQAFQEMVDAGADVEKGIEPDLRYHHIILKASGNQMLVPLGHTIESALAACFRISSSVPSERVISLGRHEAVMNAIAAHDGELAAEAMCKLIDGAQKVILTLIE